MRKIRDVLRLKQSGRSHGEIARSRGERNACIGERTRRIRDWVGEWRLVPASALIRRKQRYAIRVGYCAVRLTFTAAPITLVVCEGFGLQPLMFLTNIEVGNLDKAVEWVEAYLARWGVEEGCRFVKQAFDLENVRSLPGWASAASPTGRCGVTASFALSR